MNISYIINYRTSDDYRYRNLITTLNWTSKLSNLKTILVEQDTYPRLIRSELPGNCNYIFAYNPGLFNRSWGFNIGCRNANSNIICLADGDILINKSNLVNSFKLCYHRYDAVNPYGKILDLTQQETQTLNGAGLNKLHWSGLLSTTGKVRPGTSFCGGVVVFRKNIYEQIGGFDERFQGWGGEDDAMTIKLNLLVKNTYQSSSYAFHLWHKSDSNNITSQESYKKNLELLCEYKKYKKSTMLKMCEKLGSKMGDRLKYLTNRSI